MAGSRKCPTLFSHKVKDRSAMAGTVLAAATAVLLGLRAMELDSGGNGYAFILPECKTGNTPLL